MCTEYIVSMQTVRRSRGCIATERNSTKCVAFAFLFQTETTEIVSKSALRKRRIALGEPESKLILRRLRQLITIIRARGATTSLKLGGPIPWSRVLLPSTEKN